MMLSRKIGLVLFWLLFAVSAFAQGPALTTVSYTYARPDGSLPSGSITISNPPFTSPDGFPIDAATKTTQFLTGAISVQLVPTQGGSPDKQLYTVLITPQGNPTVQEFWSVPQSAGAVDHAAVISYQTPLPNPLIGIPEGGTGASTAVQARINLGITNGSVTGFSATNLSPIFNSSVATPSSTPALSFSLLSADPDSIFGNFSGATAGPAYGGGLLTCGDSTHALGYLNHSFECQSLSSGTSLPPGIDPLASDGLGAPIPTHTVINVMSEPYNAKCDTRMAGDGAMSSTVNSTWLSSTALTFTSADIGKAVTVDGAGSAGAVLFSTILSINSSTVAVLADAASTTVSGKGVSLGTDDSPAFAAAIAAIPEAPSIPYGTVDAGGGTVLVPPSATPCNLCSARLAVNKSKAKISGYGATLLCNVPDDCSSLGDLTNINSGIDRITIEGFAFEPGAGSAGHSAIRDNAQGSRLVDIKDVVNWSTWPNHYGFNHFIENDDDFFEQGEHLYIGGGTLRCDSTFCGSYVWGPGPFATNAGITYLSGGFNISPGCSGNGIDWRNGNTLSIRDGVIEGYNQFAIRAYTGPGNSFTVNNVYDGGHGACTNPLGNVGTAGVITNSTVSYIGGQHGGELPVFTQAGTLGSTYYGYYIEGSNGSTKTAPMAAGYITNGNASVASSHITATWPDYEVGHPAYTYRVLRSTAGAITAPAPYGTGNWDVSGPLAEGTYCTAGLCTFVDTVASPSSYTVSGNTGYSPYIGMWGGSVILSNGANYSGDPLALGGIFVTPNPGTALGQSSVNLIGGSTSAYYQDPEPYSPITTQAVGMSTLYQPPNALVTPVYFGVAGYGAGLKGWLNFNTKTAPTDIETLVDSNPAKTQSYLSQQPPYDTGDTAACLDATGLCFRAPTSISQYINSKPENENWLERTTSALKMFKLSLGSFSVAGISPPYVTGVTDVPTGGSLSPSTQYCYYVTALDNLGETIPYAYHGEYCVTTASGGGNTHSIQIEWPFAASPYVTRGYNVYGRTTGAEQLMTPTPVPTTARDPGNTPYMLWTDTGSVTPSGAMPAANTTGRIQPALYSTATNCSSSASPAVCGAASAGSVVIAASATSVVVDTTAVTASSQILLTEDSSLGSKLSVTCNTQSLLTLGVPKVTARSAGTSFTASIEVGPTSTPMCFTYAIVN